MKIPFSLHRCPLCAVVIVWALALLLPSCRLTPAGGHRDAAHYAEVDSLMQAMSDVDSIAAMVKQYQSQSDATGEMLALKRQGSRLRKLSRYDEAIEVHQRGLDVATRICDSLEIMAALNNIATDYRRKGELSKANGFHFEALKMSDTYSDHDSPEAIKSRVITLNGIGNIEIELCNYDAADSVLHMALEGETRLGSNLGMAINYANIGAVKQALGETDSAWVYFRKSFEYNQMAGSQEGEGLCHLHYGELYEEERNLSHAKEEYKLAYDKLKELGETYHWLESCLPLARVCILLNDLDEARRYLQEAEDGAEHINSLEQQCEAYQIHYELAMIDGNVQQALDYYVKSKELYDSIYGLEKSDEMRSQRIDYQAIVKSGKMSALNNDISRLKRMRNMMAALVLALVLMAGGIIAALVYAVRTRNRTQRMLSQVEETRTLFFTNVVHQLRTPLTAIMGATDNIVASRGEAVPAAQLEDIEVIERQGKNLLTLVDRILEVGSVRSALREPEWRTGDAVSFVRMVVESFRERCVERHIELTYMPQGANVDIDTVPRYLATILDSLIENAINYSKDYSKITVTSSIEDAYFVIKVSDVGIGIPSADLPHVFEPFYRGAVAEHLIEGVGIGLTVVRDMAMAMDGSVEATSVKDNGSCFTVKLPIKHGNGVKERLELAMEPIVSRARRRQDDTEEGSSARDENASLPLVLIVEDHADVAQLVGKALQGVCSAIYASDGVQALTKMAQQRPDLLITDVKMPLMDGLELCRQVRASRDLRNIPIIMLSARNNEVDKVKGIEAGADIYMVKPFARDELRAWTRHVLSRRYLIQSDIMSLAQQAVQPVSGEPKAAIDGGSMDDTTVVDRFNQEVEKLLDAGTKLDIDKIAFSLKMGESQLRRTIQEQTGKSIAAHVTQLRMRRAMHLLKSRPDLRIGDVAEQCGFLDVAYFSRVFRQHYGMTPTQARNGAE